MTTEDNTTKVSDGDVLCKTDSSIPSRNGEKRGLCGRFLKMWKKFGDNTSMHGLGRAINSSRIWKKIVWTILVLIAACVASRNLYMTFVDYFSYPVSTTVTLETKPYLNFPAVTLCNLNPYRFSYLKEEIKEEIVKDMMDGKSVAEQKEHFTILFNKLYNVFDLPKNITHSLKDMLVDCQYDMGPCSDEDFMVVPNIKHGPCFTFNSESSGQMVSFRAGNKNGLIMELDVQQDEYLPFTPAAGLKLLIHPPDVVPFAHEDGIIVRPGVATSVGLRKVEVERQIQPWGKCFRASETNYDDINMFRSELFNGHSYGYSQMACEKTCYQNELQSSCQCCDISYPCFSSENNPLYECNMTQKDVLECHKQVRTNYLSGTLGCGEVCWPPCHETIYQTSYSVAAWPSEKYVDNFNKKAAKVRKERNITGVVTTDQLRMNYVRLEVHYETMTEKSIVASPAYNWNKLLSDLGGQLGLWMGFSLMTAIEFLELGWDFIGKLCLSPCSFSRNPDSTKV